MLISMFSLLGTVAFAESEYDSGNMLKAFFTKNFWNADPENTSAFELADG